MSYTEKKSELDWIYPVEEWPTCFDLWGISRGGEKKRRRLKKHLVDIKCEESYAEIRAHVWNKWKWRW